MKGKLPILLHILSVVTLFVVFGLIFSVVDENKRERLELLKVRADREEFSQSSTKEKNVANNKLVREKGRVDELKAKLDELRADLSQKEEEFLAEKQKIADVENQIQARKDIILNATEAQNQINLEKQVAKANVEALVAEVSNFENQLFDIQQQTERGQSRIAELYGKLKEYDVVTDQLRNHFNNSLRGIRQYTRDRPWIEVGEKLSASFHSLDMGTGTIAIPLGSDAGIQLGMLFSVKNEKNEVCKIKITEVRRQSSLGRIIPLHGTPHILTSLKKIDLVNL
jgi:hypothetical protein